MLILECIISGLAGIIFAVSIVYSFQAKSVFPYPIIVYFKYKKEMNKLCLSSDWKIKSISLLMAERTNQKYDLWRFYTTFSRKENLTREFLNKVIESVMFDNQTREIWVSYYIWHQDQN